MPLDAPTAVGVLCYPLFGRNVTTTKNDSRTTASQLLPAVRAVLSNAAKERGEYTFLTAHQILAELPRDVREKLIAEYGPAGGGVGNRYGASGPVAAVGVMLERSDEVEITFLDARRVRFDVPEQEGLVSPSGPTLGLYRLKK